MNVMVRLRASRYLAWCLLSVAAVPTLSVGAMAAERGTATQQSVVLFPLEKDASVTSAQVNTELNSYVSEGLSAYKGYRLVSYSERLPAVQRLVALQPDKKAVVAGPFSTDPEAVGRAVTLGQAMVADLVIVGSVTKYTFNSQTGQSDVTVSAQVLDGKSGKAVQTIAVTGSATMKPKDAQGVSESAVRKAAVKDAGSKMIKAITGEEYQEPGQTSAPVIQSKKNSKKAWIPMLLLSLGVGLLLGGGHGDSGGSGSSTGGGIDNPPAPPHL